MSLVFERVFTLLVTFPGNLVYQLVIAFAIVGVLVAALNQWQLSRSPKAYRMVLGLGLLLGFQGVAFVLAAAGVVNLLDPRAFMPVLDRLVLVSSLALVIWLWAFPTPSKMADAAALLMFFLTVLGGILTQFVWVGEKADIWFNLHWLSLAWSGAGALVSLVGLGLVTSRRPPEWGPGAAFFAVNLAGFAFDMVLQPASYDYSGILRLVSLVTYPLLFTLPQRFLMPAPQKNAQPPTQSVNTQPTRRRFGVDPQVLDAFLALFQGQKEHYNLCHDITRLTAQSMLADISFVLSMPDLRGDIILQCGYDLVREKILPGAAFNENSAPILSAALVKGRALRLPAASTSPDLTTISSLLDLQKNGHLLLAPIQAQPESPILGGLVVLSPYSNRNWSPDEQIYLEKLGRVMAVIIQNALASQPDSLLDRHAALAQESLSPLAEALQQDLQIARATIQSLSEQNDMLSKQIADLGKSSVVDADSTALQQAVNEKARERIRRLTTEVEHLQQQLAVKPDPANLQSRIAELEAENARLQTNTQAHRIADERLREIAYLKKVNQESLLIIESLRSELTELEQSVSQSASDAVNPLNVELFRSIEAQKDQLETDLRKALEEIARLQIMVGEAKIRMFTLERQAANAIQAQGRLQVVLNMARELRSPMASIVGYIDFLLTESVGILGNLQRKFLEKIKSSVDRLSELVDGLTQGAELEHGKLSLTPPRIVSLNDVIVDVTEKTRAFVKSKDLSLALEIPEQLPFVQGDEEALNQVLLHLLSNAVEVTPPGGEVTLRAIVESFGDGHDFLHLQVQDQGPGIDPEDLPQVFANLADHANQPIEGVGQNNIRLSLTKSLVDAHGGRVWVDSEPGKGARFSILFPVNEDPDTVVSQPPQAG